LVARSRSCSAISISEGGGGEWEMGFGIWDLGFGS
jgi:hypothetical protein